jgi:membrane protease YdiL (CAAX protease family)
VSDAPVDEAFVAGAPTGEPAWRIGLEVVALWLVVNLVIRAVRVAWESGAWELILGLVPLLFMYAPVLVCRLRKVDSWAYPLALPALRDWGVWRQALLLNAVVIGIVGVPFVVGYHYWHLYVLGDAQVASGWPVQWPTVGGFALLVGYHVFFVAIPEEFFYRGYLQTRLDEAFRSRWRVVGAVVGPGLILATVLFAFGHSIVVFQPWHAAIVLPGLVFAWMRARTGEVVAGALFHAWCNVTVTTLDILYGLQPP